MKPMKTQQSRYVACFSLVQQKKIFQNADLNSILPK